MNAVFLGGSRSISQLNSLVVTQLDEYILNDFWIFVGDASGADRAFQQFFARRNCKKVVVYCIAGNLRNNVGNWDVRKVDAPKGVRGFDLYSLKDIRMANDATTGLMLWDGKSRGTFENVRNLLAHGKSVMVYVNPLQRIVNLSSATDIALLSADRTTKSKSQFDLPFMNYS